jgi:uncharacterized membrane protein required for colicin V production
MPNAPDSWHTPLLVFALGLVLFQAWQGWRLGVVRQALRIAAIASGYAAGVFWGGALVPFLRPIGLPDAVLNWIGGALLAIGTFLAVSMVSAVLFKKTTDQSLRLVRWGYGALGALAGACLGLVYLWASLVVIRLLGSVAPAPASARESADAPAVVRWARNIARGVGGMKQTLDQDGPRAVLDRLDPFPDRLNGVLAKVGQVSAQPQVLPRLQTDPRLQSLLRNPKIQALQRDPEVARAAGSRDLVKYLGLLHHPKVVDALNDEEVVALLKEVDLEKALDHALQPPDREPARRPGR